MRWLVRLFYLLALIAASHRLNATTAFHLVGDEPGPWPNLLSSIGLQAGGAGANPVYVVRQASLENSADWARRVKQGAFLILEGDSPAAIAFGFTPSGKTIEVRSIVDLRRPQLPIVWEHALSVPVFQLPAGAQLFARERWSGAPVLAGLHHGRGAVLWVASSPGVAGHERYPYILQALTDLGLQPPLRSSRLWAFFDSSYRQRVDLDYFAERWQRAGIAGLHVAAWHYFEPEATRDAYLQKLIEACHRRGITVYAWLELPHVSEKFWNEHPEWRERTAIGQDAQLDWRKLMNLQNPDCQRAVAEGTHALIDRFDWDGVNLAELYFESLEGIANPARFTPFNADVRRDFQRAAGYDPAELFQPKSRRDPADFLAFRAELARQMQVVWLGEMQNARRRHPDLAVTLTHVDDRYDRNMRNLIGADAGRLLPLLDQQDFTFLVEDPATLWHLGPERYPKIAAQYQPLTARKDRLAIDINIVERYQDVYPTKQQTGGELFSLVHLAARAFPRVALYFENSILPADWHLLPAAAAVATRYEQVGQTVAVDSPYGVGIQWTGPAQVDGNAWPVTDGATLWLPPGPHAVSGAAQPTPHRLLHFNGLLRTASANRQGLQFSYENDSRAYALLDRRPSHLSIDGADTPILGVSGPQSFCLVLPRGQHVVDVFLDISTISQ